MNPRTQQLALQGPAGSLQALVDRPDLAAGQTSVGVAVIAHPHPLFGGTMDNKVVQTLARAFVQAGWMAVRFNFRGVGASEGAYDEGRGELQDLLAVIDHFSPAATQQGALALAGFSFGAFVTSHAVQSLHAVRSIDRLVLVGTAAGRFEVAPLPQELHAKTLVLHGEEDDTVPLAAALDWARPQNLPVMVLPAVGHFFHGQLPLLRDLVVRHVAVPLA
jgi:alpha/beta superfamily hydrolase